MQGLFKRYGLRREGCSERLRLDARFWIHLQIPVCVSRGVKWENIFALIDTAFDGGLALPRRLKNRMPEPDCRIFRGRVDVRVEGKERKRDFYSVAFQILTQSERPIQARSDFVLFLDREYGLIGMDFLKKNDGVVAVDGANQLLSFAAYLSDNDDRWGHWQDRCRQIHQIFPDP